ncbi:MAG TPA: type II toxin-antitoxin system antitoxin SocA domain-containing protein [Planctomycetota bacterium]|nr:type II toxin-antitoxin system antitoxin SocA domain-containing protein [Planctomycetota bacterium]
MKRLGQRIKALRESAGMNQQQLSERLGLPRVSISQIENGERDVCADELVGLSGIFSVSVDNLLNLEKEPQVIIEEGKKMTKLKPQMRINVPQKNVDKFKEVLLYILNKVGAKPNIGETVIYKLLYFIDFNFYEKYEEQLIGATYIRNKFGPTPMEFATIVAKMIKDKEVKKVEDKYFQYDQKKYLPLREPNLDKIKASEIKLIDEVLANLSDKTASDISEYSHNDVPWLTTPDGEKIEYESVFYRTAPYSARK